MGKNKRSNAPLDYDEPSKRPRHSSDGPPKGATQGRVDPTYGQRSAFPGLDEYSTGAIEDEDLEYGDDVSAMRYLQAVRSEAAGIPTLLVAPKPAPEEGAEADRSIYDDGLGDSRGFYSDGAYTAAPILGPDAPTTSSSGLSTREPRAVYFDKILERFMRLRTQLNNTPPRHVVESLDKDHGSYMTASAEDYRKWRWRIANTEPMSAQLAGMDKATLLRLLRLMINDKHAMGGKGVVTARTSRWVWGLLARLPERGELNSEEIGLVRELGKRAVWLGVGMRGFDTSGLDDEQDNEDDEDAQVDDDIFDVGVEEEEDADESGAQDSPIIGPVLPKEAREEYNLDRTAESSIEDENRLALARERLLSQLDNIADSKDAESVEAANEKVMELERQDRKGEDALAELQNARATIDMIITVAGEVYGQRDLLEFREMWD